MKYLTCLLLSVLPAVSATVVVDASKAGAPISKYIYGQFIEHLGRCIYGGLWAEMLEDRKFFYTVDGEAPAWEMFTPGPRSYDGEGRPYEVLARSPWMIVGPKQAVSMSTANALVGQHAPEIRLPGNGGAAGLIQERLGLLAGREYDGRVVVAGSPGAGPVEVSLVWGGGATMRQSVAILHIGAEYATYPLRFRAGRSTDNGRLEIVAKGSGSFRIGAVSLMPSDNIHGWRADTLALLKELNSPVYRWPGGNFVSGYDWKDGIGDPDKRPPRKNPAWKGVEPNDVGIHEYMALMREIGAEPYIAVNTGLADEGAAAQEVEYLNGSAGTPLGKLRAQNGHPEPFGVQWFAVGNEMYGAWQLGNVPLEEYVKKHNRVVEAMRKVDAGVRPVGVGNVGRWSEQMLTTCADFMNLISEHLYWQNRPDLAAHVAQVPAQIRGVAEAHREYRRRLPSLAGKDIRIAMDEWNYWYGPNDFGELGVRAGRAWDCRRATRILPQFGYLLHGELRANRERDRGDQDHAGKRGVGDDRAGFEAVSPAFRSNSSRGNRRAGSARCGGCLDGGPVGPDGGHRESYRAGAVHRFVSQRRATDRAGDVLGDRRSEPAGAQRPRKSAGNGHPPGTLSREWPTSRVSAERYGLRTGGAGVFFQVTLSARTINLLGAEPTK
jgi:alpha-N-arabinofuranosidase